MTHLVLDQIDSGYGNLTVLHEVSLTLDSATGVTALMGANGAGKSTLCRTIAGIISPTRGRIEIDGDELRRPPPRVMVGRGVVLVPEGRQVFASMTVEENLLMGAYLRSKGVSEDLGRIMDQFPILASRRAQAAGNLSGGEQQMLAIGRALMARPSVLMLDEPTHGLAPVVVEEVIETMHELARSGVLILLVEQNVHVAKSVASKVVLMANGRVVGDGPADEMFDGELIRDVYLGGEASRSPDAS